jgi:hypothetical protein
MFLIVMSGGCNQQQASTSQLGEKDDIKQPDSVPLDSIVLPVAELSEMAGKGALLLTRVESFEALKKIIRIEYLNSPTEANPNPTGKPGVRLTHSSDGREITSLLTTGVSEGDFLAAQDSGIFARVQLVLRSPYSVWHRKDLRRAFALSRKRGAIFGVGDPAFYDLAETMSIHITDYDKAKMTPKDLGEKGYINTFNHFIAQSMVTSIFSERLADLIADAHERYNMPELILGEFTTEQLADLETGPTDNYLDIINNEWGQEFGKVLREKYNITRKTYWTTELLENYLNDIQVYFSCAFQIAFEPFRATDELVIRFSNKINTVMDDVPIVR